MPSPSAAKESHQNDRRRRRRISAKWVAWCTWSERRRRWRPRTSCYCRGAPGNNDAGGGGAGGVNGVTAAAVPAGSFNGGNGGDATPAINPNTFSGGGGGAGGYGLALTTAGRHTTAAGQVFTGGNGGAGNGTGSGLRWSWRRRNTSGGRWYVHKRFWRVGNWRHGRKLSIPYRLRP